MFGIILGTLCLIALFAVARRERYRRYGFAYGGGPWGYHHHAFHRHAHAFAHAHGHFGHHGYAGGARGRFGRGQLVNGVLASLETTPGQDRAITEAFETFFDRVRDASKTREAAHARIARAVASDTLDAQALQAGLAHEGELGAELRAELAAALSRVHEALDPRQRKRLGELIEEGLLARAFGRPL